MILNKYLVLAAAALAIGACSDDEGATGTRGPTALVRFVHAVPDTMRVNALFVDEPLENLPNFQGISFRNSSGLYQQVVAGERDIRVFPDTTNILYATQRLIDTTVTLVAGSRYTLVYSGNARGNNDYLAVIEDDRPDPAATSIAVRAIHLARGAADVDVHVAATGADPLTAPATSFTGLAYLDASAYDELPALTGTNLYQFAVTDAGAGTLRISPIVSPNVPGADATATGISAQAGVRKGGSVLTALYVPGAVAGSMAVSGANTTPTVILLKDNVPGT
jgi:hypothetical protein